MNETVGNRPWIARDRVVGIILGLLMIDVASGRRDRRVSSS
jgi:hypothetical protein